MLPDRVIQPLDPAVALLQEVSALETLADVFAWGRARPGGTSTPAVIADVVVQDEFTHDAIVPVTESLVIVFGST
jgi:hypothetical protein